MAIEVRDLVKVYGSHRVVDEISFTVQSGETLALLGPNGAGKTTTVEILEGFRRPDGGTVRVLGFEPIADGRRLKRRIGVMLQASGLYPAITPIEAISLFSRFYDHPRTAAELVQLTGLKDAVNTRYRRLSGGEKQRLALALALVGRPELLFLDEPTTGLDPGARRAAWDTIAALRAEGVTILLTTHYLEEAEKLADTVAIVTNGKLVALGPPNDLGSHGPALRLRTAAPVDPAALNDLPAISGLRVAERNTYLIECPEPATAIVQLATLLRDLDVPLVEIKSGHGTLEEVFLELVGDTDA